MITSQQINPGIILSIDRKLFRVETCVKVAPPKGKSFIRTKLRSLETKKVMEKNFKIDQTVQEVSLETRDLEFLYAEGKEYLFLDIHNLEEVPVSAPVVGETIHYLKEGVEVKASLYDGAVFAIELPQFLEFMVVEAEEAEKSAAGSPKSVTLETGAKIEVPPFIEVGDIIKIDTKTHEYIQRV